MSTATRGSRKKEMNNSLWEWLKEKKKRWWEGRGKIKSEWEIDFGISPQCENSTSFLFCVHVADWAGYSLAVCQAWLLWYIYWQENYSQENRRLNQCPPLALVVIIDLVVYLWRLPLNQFPHWKTVLAPPESKIPSSCRETTPVICVMSEFIKEWHACTVNAAKILLWRGEEEGFGHSPHTLSPMPLTHTHTLSPSLTHTRTHTMPHTQTLTHTYCLPPNTPAL